MKKNPHPLQPSSIQFSGNMAKIGHIGLKPGYFSSIPSKRGVIKGLSNSSIKRLTLLLARVDFFSLSTPPLFCTLTFPPSRAMFALDSKAVIDRFFKSIRRSWPSSSAIWRLESHKSGLPHYHLIFFGIPPSGNSFDPAAYFIERDRISAIWSQSLDYPYSTVFQLEPIRTPLAAQLYLTAGHSVKKSQSYRCAVGRHWGVFNRPMLPLSKIFNAIPTPFFLRVLRKMWKKREQRRVIFWKKKGRRVKERDWRRAGSYKIFSFSIKKLVDNLEKAGYNCLYEAN